MKIGITGRKTNHLAKQTALKAMELLDGKTDFIVNSDFLNVKGRGKKLSEFDCDIILAFGGDGTLLSTLHGLKKKIPIMGINCGNKGFLASFDHGQIEDAILAVLNKKYHVEERTRICAKVDGKLAGEALNEVLIVPEKSGRLLEYRIKIGKDERLEAGDGLIVATPTGSTAHALSAGGPIVKGNAAVFVVVSINPVERNHRPLVINDHEKVSVSDFGKMNAEVVIDGQKWFKVTKTAEFEKGQNILLAVREYGRSK